jgi:hypothetical protein
MGPHNLMVILAATAIGCYAARHAAPNANNDMFIAKYKKQASSGPEKTDPVFDKSGNDAPAVKEGGISKTMIAIIIGAVILVLFCCCAYFIYRQYEKSQPQSVRSYEPPPQRYEPVPATYEPVRSYEPVSPNLQYVPTPAPVLQPTVMRSQPSAPIVQPGGIVTSYSTMSPGPLPPGSFGSPVHMRPGSMPPVSMPPGSMPPGSMRSMPPSGPVMMSPRSPKNF